MKSLFSGYLPAIAWLVISFILLMLPGTAFPQENWLSRIYFDKWVHIIMFLMLVWLFCRAYHYHSGEKQTPKKTFLLILVLAFIFGIAIEFIQKKYIPYRSFDIGDIIADGVGGIIGYIIAVAAASAPNSTGKSS